MNNAVIIIPARYKSSRLPGKPLVDIRGKSMIRRTWEQCTHVLPENKIYVATDDQRIVDHCAENGMQAVMTGEDCLTGTDRVYQAALQIEADIYINVQGDEALVDAGVLTAAALALEGNDMGTVATSAAAPSELASEDVVKVWVDPRTGRALDFSRRWLPGTTLAHVGVYAFWRHALRHFASLDQSARERAEGLEQLRALEGGLSIGVETVPTPHLGINRPADLDALAQLRGAGQQRRTQHGNPC